MAVEWKIKDIYKADAEIVYSEINSIGNEYTPQQIVEKARDESTELHKLFEWNDSIAAEKYRCEQASKIIRMLVVKNDNSEAAQEPVITTRAIVCRNTNDNYYQPITTTVRNEDQYQKLLRTALSELEAFKRKYSVLSELEAVISAIEETLRVA